VIINFVIATQLRLFRRIVRVASARHRAVLDLTRRRWFALDMKYGIFGGPSNIPMLPYPEWDSFDENCVWVHAEDAELLFCYFRNLFDT
jgi:hypothetical protein